MVYPKIMNDEYENTKIESFDHFQVVVSWSEVVGIVWSSFFLQRFFFHFLLLPNQVY